MKAAEGIATGIISHETGSRIDQKSGINLAMKHKHQRRSDCPINFALETFGDPWSLLIIRDMVYFGKKTYGEFLASEEGIATNILALRLAHLEQQGILVKKPHETEKRKEMYVLGVQSIVPC